ncbi:hypothetical protein EV702DRAFT_1049391 [Suillus placidus]|uniref:Uncharacterized protein n=1 Tax=Suillus placidus TaxID=48579 RepID=A0A9P6ZMP4_9AGAM|nr:hypothetical protein EV702DRAFT_1049391 [Suillus placidus]
MSQYYLGNNYRRALEQVDNLEQHKNVNIRPSFVIMVLISLNSITYSLIIIPKIKDIDEKQIWDTNGAYYMDDIYGKLGLSTFLSALNRLDELAELDKPHQKNLSMHLEQLRVFRDILSKLT